MTKVLSYNYAIMPSVTTEGLILKRNNFGEADRVLTVLTNRYGKISVIARGVRRITSRRAGNIEVLNRVRLHLFKSVKNYNLTEAESIETFRTLKENLTLSTTAFHIIELVDRLIPESQINSQVYDLTIAILQILEKNPRQIFIRAYEVKLLTLLGFWSINSIKDLHPEMKNLLKRLEDENWNSISKMEIDKDEASALKTILEGYIEHIIDSSLKSTKLMQKLQKA